MRMNNGTPPVDRTRKNRKELKRSKIGKTLAGLPREDYLRGGEGARTAKTAKQLIDLVGRIFCDNATSARAQARSDQFGGDRSSSITRHIPRKTVHPVLFILLFNFPSSSKNMRGVVTVAKLPDFSLFKHIQFNG